MPEEEWAVPPPTSSTRGEGAQSNAPEEGEEETESQCRGALVAIGGEGGVGVEL